MITLNAEPVELDSVTPNIVESQRFNGEVEWRVGGATDLWVTAPVDRFLPGEAVDLAYHDAVPIKAMITCIEGAAAWGERERLHLQTPPIRRP